MKLYPFVGLPSQLGATFARCLNPSSMKLEKLVTDPQYPVVRPIYSGRVFFADAPAGAGCFSLEFVGEGGGGEKSWVSSTRKPIIIQPVKLAQTTPPRGAPG